MQSANEWLLAQGHIQEITRGRRSRENTQHLTDAYNSGTRFRDFEPVESKNSQGETVTKNAVKATSQIENFAQAYIRYPGPTGNEANANSVWAVKVDGKTLPTPDDYGGLREVCFNCRLSLVGHTCDNPQLSIDGKIVSVDIVRR